MSAYGRSETGLVKQHSGVMIFLTGSPAPGHIEGVTAISAAFGAIESLMENLAVEVGSAGVRVVCLRATANSDSRAIQQTVDILASKMNVTREQLVARIASLNFLKVRPASPTPRRPWRFSLPTARA
jgi:NAD(P)-dependent dehydrogenase (short-subunit alcohol dehydrogenase family)